MKIIALIQKIIVALIFTICIGYFLLWPGIGDILIKYQGLCVKAIITDTEVGGRGSDPTLLYTFNLNGQSYHGLSLIKDKKRIGDTICVGYLKGIPSMNRPLIFYDNPINCNCR
jgi:hypothetical protein